MATATGSLGHPKKYRLPEPAPAHPEILPKRKTAKRIRLMGAMPEVKGGEIQRIAQTEPNPRSAEPFSFPRYEMAKEVQAVWRVTEAELDGLLEWGVSKLQQIFPDCTYESVQPMLRMATRGGKMFFARTEDACALFVAEVTALQPVLFVRCVFILRRIGGGIANWGVKKLYQAGRDWAKEIGACGYYYQPLAGEDMETFEPQAKQLGYTNSEVGFTLRFSAAAPVQRLIDAGNIVGQVASV